MQRIVKVLLAGCILGGGTFALIRQLTSTMASAQNYLMLAMAIYLMIGLLMTWRRSYVAKPRDLAHRVEKVSRDQDSKEAGRDHALSPYGYSFIIAMVMMLALDYFIR